MVLGAPDRVNKAYLMYGILIFLKRNTDTSAFQI